jgi:membrane-associated phospholipid phosphatase
MKPRWASAILAATLLLAAAARAEPTAPELSFQPGFKRFTPVEYAVTGALLVGTGVLILTNEERDPNWRGPVLFDDAVRDGLRGGTPGLREDSQLVSDTLYYMGLAYPYVVDVAAVALVARGAPDVAGQLALIDTEAFAITGFLSFVSNATLRRERPSVRECAEGRPDPIFPGCDDPGPNEAFYSGHTGIAFTGAALTCMHHRYLPLYGQSPVPGTVACAAMLAGATGTGALRLVADQHYVSDVLVGAGVGVASGLLVPWFHYRDGARAKPREAPLSWSALPLFTPTAAGALIAGAF